MYEGINEMLKIVGAPLLHYPDHGSEKEKLQEILTEYAMNLRKKFPWRYLLIRNNRKLPDMIAQTLSSAIAEIEDNERKAKP